MLPDNLLKQMEYTNKIGLARTISTNEDVQRPECEFLFANGFEVGNLQPLKSYNRKSWIAGN